MKYNSKKILKYTVILSIIILSISFAWANDILVLEFDGVINPISSSYILDGLEKAEDMNAECMILVMDTPGGLMESMRDITKAFMNSNVPIVVYVNPKGARAASAGVFITMAAHVAVMTPGTNIGAAHPVQMGGIGGQQQDEEKQKEQQEVMMEKAENDAVAQIRSIADERGRNADWGEAAVRESESIVAEEALKLGVIDYIADNMDSLIALLNGVKVRLPDGEYMISTENATIVRYGMKVQQRILFTLLDPTVAYLLMMLGMLGIFLELSHPGSILPGTVGGIAILLALYAFQILPINYTGVLLIVFAIILFILEIKIPSFGILTIGGVISLGLGSFLLTSGNADFLRISLKVMFPVVMGVSAFFIFIVTSGLMTLKRKVSTGKEGLVGEIGFVLKTLNPTGKVKIHGEIWNARTSGKIKKGERIIVKEVESLMWLFVEKENRDND
ncbi:nodulation protein NfeD [bacterium]|nr:nodulation protein NfeD [bacterium]